jgi:hypothetical protein
MKVLSTFPVMNDNTLFSTVRCPADADLDVAMVGSVVHTGDYTGPSPHGRYTSLLESVTETEEAKWGAWHVESSALQ